MESYAKNDPASFTVTEIKCLALMLATGGVIPGVHGAPEDLSHALFRWRAMNFFHTQAASLQSQTAPK